MTAVNAEQYEEFLKRMRETAMLGSTLSLLGWDEVTYMPEEGVEHRGNQMSFLAGLQHEYASAPALGDLISALEAQVVDLPDPYDPHVINVHEARRNFDRATKLPKRLVEELAKTQSQCQHAWVQARKQSKFSLFQPLLEKMVKLKQEQAQVLWNGEGEIYDALLDEYEPKASAAAIAETFKTFRSELVPLVAAISESTHRPDASLITRHYPTEQQMKACHHVADLIGFSFTSGRMDVSAHPFCSGMGPGDCRLTTRYDDHHFNGSFFGTLHEAGHGIYEQGLKGDYFGTAMGDTVSLGIHESQSRMWENLVGRSRGFWSYYFPIAQAQYPDALRKVSLQDFYRAINISEPSFIRVESDEVTYNLHIMLRFDLERAIMLGDLPVSDIPSAWNERFTRDFGITPPKDSQGCLQDVHWSHGLIGYFPTYSLGNMYASQFYQAAEAELGELEPQFARGEFGPLKKWLNENIHQHGKKFTAAELVLMITGKPLSAQPLVDHLWRKFGDVYQISR
jgi:carboxypeptidase Taq